MAGNARWGNGGNLSANGKENFIDSWLFRLKLVAYIYSKPLMQILVHRKCQNYGTAMELGG
ncbi:hypothetical protein VIS19158_21091 [Vibrio scophthalmi LMG 19158]|uniref:Uncharacterized protein n=1 Tax=Vibrio scophthalmi LMG 19158 TaxID=870967 RepID=F9RVT5_9VIBR|nr:hypothetical protein VIS19158_21091 [Vibrio scophthalmi LMG 19158]